MNSREKTIKSLCVIISGESSGEEISSSLATLSRDWNTFAEIAKLNRIVAPAAKNLISSGAVHKLPDAIRKTFEDAPRATAARNMVLSSAAAEITKAAAGDNLTLIPLKGISFIDRIYAIDERPMTDLDFMVAKQQQKEVAHLLGGLGYSRVPSSLPEAFENEFSGEMKYSRCVSGVDIEVEAHWDVSPEPALKKGFNLSPELLLANTIHTGGNFRLSPEAEIVFSIFHLAVRHSFSRLLWFLDLHRLCNNSEIDRGKLQTLIRKSGIENPATAVFDFLHRMFGNANAARFIEKQYIPDFLRMAIMGNLLPGNEFLKTSGVLQLLISNNPFGYVNGMLFPPVEFMKARYPGSKPLFSYVARPMGMLLKFRDRKR